MTVNFVLQEQDRLFVFLHKCASLQMGFLVLNWVPVDDSAGGAKEGKKNASECPDAGAARTAF